MAGAAANEPVRSQMRASDTDRERIASALRRAVDEGRLDLSEYDERLRAAYEAKTYGELAPLTQDLPAPASPARAAVTAPAPQPARAPRRRMAGHWRSWLTVAVIVTAIWLFGSIGSGSVQNFWPIWVIGPWGILLAFRGFRGTPATPDRHHR